MEAGTNLVELINAYNDKQNHSKGGDAIDDEVTRQRRDGAAILVPIAEPVVVTAFALAAPHTRVALPTPPTLIKTKQSLWLEWKTIRIKYRETCYGALHLPQPPATVLVLDGGQRKRNTIGQDGRVP